MTTVGYYIRGSTVDDATWALVCIDHHFNEEIVVGGLAYKDVVALYWEKLATLQKQLTSRADEQPLDDAPTPGAPRKRQLTFKF